MDADEETRRSSPFPGSRTFFDRREAGRLLAQRLESHQGPRTLVLGIPRGGVPVAAEVAHHLGAELDVAVARKIGAPNQPELALGAVTANGGLFVNEKIVQDLRTPDPVLQALAERQRHEARRQEEQLRGQRPPPNIAGRTVILVDDGLATGATMRAAVRSVRAARPSRLVVAVPVGAPSTCASLRSEADEVVSLLEPDPFLAVGLYYRHFEPPTDAEVQRLLATDQTA